MISVLSYLLLTTGHFGAVLQLVAEIVPLSVLCIIAWHRKGARVTSLPLSADPADRTVLYTGLLALFGLLLICVGTFASLSLNKPHGGWDGWAIWNLRARFFFRGAAYWHDAFSTWLYWSHPDYPLMLPISIARSWLITGGETVMIPIFIAGLFTFGSVGLLFAGLAASKSWLQGMIAGAVLLATPNYIAHGASQYADMPLAFCFLAFAVVCTLRSQMPTLGHLVILGFLAALGAWIKNEGLLFFLIASAGVILVLWLGNTERRWKEIAAFVAGALPIALILFHFKTQIAPESDLPLLQDHNGLVLLAKLYDRERHWLIVKTLFAKSLSFGLWPVSVPVVLAIYFYLVGKAPVNFTDRFTIVVPVLLGMMLIGYYLIYLITPFDLAWHLKNSADRLLLQLWPSILFAYFSLVRAPNE